jgi:serine/threonine protein kinase
MAADRAVDVRVDWHGVSSPERPQFVSRANVKVRSDGTVKVLDFGLAKAIEDSGATGRDGTHSATITTPAMTHAGMILGTAACMSPEQAKGKADRRRKHHVKTLAKRSSHLAFESRSPKSSAQ